MDSERLQYLQERVKQINALEKQYQESIYAMRMELFAYTKEFESYAEVYTFCKHVCATQEEFNVAMLHCSDMLD